MALAAFEHISYPLFLRLQDLFATSLDNDWLKSNQGVIERVQKIYAKNRLTRWQKIQHFLGYGPVGFHTINYTIEQIAQKCIHDCVQPFKDTIQKIRSHQIKDCTKEEEDQARLDLAHLREIIRLIYKTHQGKHQLLNNVRIKFYRQFDTTLSKCAFAMAGILDIIRSIPRAIWNRLMIDSTERLLSTRDVYQTLIEAYSKPYPIWRANNAALEIYFIPKSDCHQLKIFKDKKCIGDVTFYGKKLNNEDRPSLHVTHYKALDPTAEGLFAHFFNHLKVQARLGDRPYVDHTGHKIFDERGYAIYPDTYCSQKSWNDLVVLQSILDDSPRKPSPFLLRITDILETLKCL